MWTRMLFVHICAWLSLFALLDLFALLFVIDGTVSVQQQALLIAVRRFRMPYS
jgi:hypothetical protein